MNHFYIRSFQQSKAFVQSILTGIDHSTNTSLNNEFRTLNAGLIRYVKRSTIRVIARACYFGNGVGFCMEYIRNCISIFILANVLKARRSTVETIRDNHFIFHNQRTNLSSRAIGVFSPNECHSEITVI